MSGPKVDSNVCSGMIYKEWPPTASTDEGLTEPLLGGPAMTKATPAIDRVLARCVESDVPFNGSPCWIFTGSLTKGYGRVGDGDKVRLTHRVVYEALVGPIPDGLQLDHLCRVRSCCNPAHLEPVTNRVNVLRGEGPSARNAQATHCPQGHAYDAENTRIGEDRGRYCRVCLRARTAAQAAAIKAAHEYLGMTQVAYAATYGRSTATALRVVSATGGQN